MGGGCPESRNEDKRELSTRLGEWVSLTRFSLFSSSAQALRLDQQGSGSGVPGQGSLEWRVSYGGCSGLGDTHSA